MIATLALSTSCQLGESPVWCDLTQRLYFIDILRQWLGIYQPDSEQFVQIELPCLTSALVLTDDPQKVLLVSDQGILLYSLLTFTILQHVAAYPEQSGVTRPNEAMVSPDGDLFFGTMGVKGQQGAGHWYQLEAATLNVSMIGPPMGITNTLCWFGNQLYFADSAAATIYCTTDNMLSMRSCVTLDHGVPDGSTICAEGRLWNAQWGGACITRYCGLPNTFTQDRVIDLPVIQPTSCVFGGANLSTLYITSARVGLENPDDYQGALLKIEHAGHGRIAHRFPLGMGVGK